MKKLCCACLPMMAFALLGLGWHCRNSEGPAASLRIITLPAGLDERKQIGHAYAAVTRLLPLVKTKPILLAQAFGELGMACHGRDYLELARDCYTNANRLDQEEYRWAYYLGRVQRSLGELAQSDEAFQTVLRLRPGHVSAMFWLAENANDRGHYEEADAHYQLAGNIDSSCAKCFYGRGKVAFAQGNYQSAVAFLEHALVLQPQASQLHYNMGLALRELGDSSRARKHFALAEAHPARKVELTLHDPLMAAVRAIHQDALSHEHHAQKALERGDYDGAIKAFRRALQLEGDRPDARYNLAMALLRLGRRHEARQELDLLLSQKPEHAPTLVLLGNLSLDEAEPAPAEAFFRRAVEADPAGAGGWLGLADVFRQEGRFQEALKHYQKATAIDSALLHARLGEVMSLVLLGQFEEALGRLETHLEVFPDFSQGTWLSARLWSAMAAGSSGYRAKTRKFIRDSEKEGLTLFEMETLAMAFASLNRFAEAVQWQTRARELSDGRPEGIETTVGRLKGYQQKQPCEDLLVDSEFVGLAQSSRNKKGRR